MVARGFSFGEQDIDELRTALNPDLTNWGFRGRATTTQISQTHVLFAACSEKESAFERDGRGLFTKALFSVLEKVQFGDSTYEDLLEKLAASGRFDQYVRTLLFRLSPWYNLLSHLGRRRVSRAILKDFSLARAFDLAHTSSRAIEWLIDMWWRRVLALASR